MAKKQSQYFPHDCNARNDDKIIAVRMRHQMEGYGVYFAILERLRESTNYMCVKDYTVIAFDLRVSAEIVKSIIENFGLFQFTEDRKFFYSDKFIERMQPLEILRKQRSEAGKKSAKARLQNQAHKTTVEPSLNDRATNKIKEDKTKENINTKVLTEAADKKQSKSKNSFTPPIISDVVEYYTNEKNLTVSDAEYWANRFIDFYTSNGWKVGKNKMVDWKATARNTLKWEDTRTRARYNHPAVNYQQSNSRVDDRF